MICFDNPIEIDDDVFYRDDAIATTFYQAGHPSYRFNQYMHPKLSLILYRWDPGQHKGEITGGLLLLDVIIDIDNKQRRKFQKLIYGSEIFEKVASSQEINVQVIPYAAGELRVTLNTDKIDNASDISDNVANVNDSCSVSIARPLSETTAVAMKHLLLQGGGIIVSYSLVAHGCKNQMPVKRNFTVEDLLPPLDTMIDATGIHLDSRAFVEHLEIGTAQFLYPQTLMISLSGNFDRLNIVHATVYVEFDKRDCRQFEFTSENTTHEVVVHRENDTREYQFWVGIMYQDNKEIVFSPREIATSSVVFVNLYAHER